MIYVANTNTHTLYMLCACAFPMNILPTSGYKTITLAEHDLHGGTKK
jgi:hypothetical protein